MRGNNHIGQTALFLYFRQSEEIRHAPQLGNFLAGVIAIVLIGDDAHTHLGLKGLFGL